jgi:hypothetical protein
MGRSERGISPPWWDLNRGDSAVAQAQGRQKRKMI